MSIINFGFESIGQYLTKASYSLPDYQREYSWIREQQIDDFWADLEKVVDEDRDSHFFGQIVIHDSMNKKKYIIDGQQRTATSVIFLAVLRDLLKEIVDNHSYTSAQNKYEDIRIKLIGRWSEDENELKLSLGEIDEEYFRENIQKNKPLEEIPEKESHKNILSAYKYFEEKLRKKINTPPNYIDKFTILLKYYNKFVDDFKLMYVETNDENEAYIIFETLNARGKDLETSDLLKNHLFRTSGKVIDIIKKNWMIMVANLDSSDITKFLRHYWNSRDKFTREKDLYKNIRDKINTPKQCEEFVKNVSIMSEVYRELINPSEFNFFTDDEINTVLLNLRIINASSFYPTILSMKNNAFSENDIKKVASLIETLFLRNCVVAGKVANRYEKLFGNLGYDISEKKLTTSDEICNKIKKEILNDEEFENAFKVFCIKSSTVAKYILREINNFNEEEINVIDDNRKINLEHIMPRNITKWSVKAEDHEKYLHRIGNLTLLSERLNKKVKNDIFKTKKTYYEKSKITITSSLKDYTNWDISSIQDRQSKLFDVAKKRWAI